MGNSSLENNQPALQQTDVSGSFLFDKSLLDKAIIKQPYYAMGVDTCDKNALAYCLSRKVDGVVEILLCKTVLLNMAFNMGVKGLLGFRNTLTFISQKNYEQAARNMTQSLWYKQVGKRAVELTERMRTQQISAAHAKN